MNAVTERADLTATSPASMRMDLLRWSGAVTELVGLLIESRGPAAPIGSFCEILTSSGKRIRTQVVGFRNGRVLSIPLEETDGLQLGDRIVARLDDARVAVGPDLLGRVIDGFGLPMDGGPRIRPALLVRSLRHARPVRSPARTSAHPLDHRHPRHRQPAALRPGPERRSVWRKRRRQEHAARRHGPRKFRRRHRHRADRRAQSRGARLHRE